MVLATRSWNPREHSALSFTELGLGTVPLGNLHKAVTEADADAVLETAWQGGVRYFDTAPLYGMGLAETRLNRFLRGKPRDSYVLSTKVGRLLRATTPEMRDGIGKWVDVPSRREVYDYSYDGVMRSLDSSLERLGIDRVDILFAHDLDVANHGTSEALVKRLLEFMNGGYRALLDLRDQKVIHAFGAGVNEWQPCQWLSERGDFDMFLVAGRYTLLEQEPLDSFFPLCLERGIRIIVGGPYNSGILATGTSEGAMHNYEPAKADVLERVRRIEAVCQRNGVLLADAALRFPLCHPAVLSVIPGCHDGEQMEVALRAASASIPGEYWDDLKAEGLLRESAPTD